MDAPLPQQKYQIEFEQSAPPFHKNFKRGARRFFQDSTNPYLLDASDYVPSLFFIRNRTLVKLKYDTSKESFVGDKNRKPFEVDEGYYPDDDQFELLSVKISPCQKYLAVITFKTIWIYTVAPDFAIMEVNGRNVNFRISPDEPYDYMTIQWPPLSESYINNPCFLSIDSASNIRLHSIKDHATVALGHEKVRFADFSHDGKRIVSINNALELCFMDPNTLETLYKKTIPKLNCYKNADVVHVFQIDQNHMAIGAFHSFHDQVGKGDIQNKFQPIVFILCGDFTTADGEIRAYSYQMDMVYHMSPNFDISFKFQYLKEKSLLFYTHADSHNIYTLHFGKDGSIIQFPTVRLPEGTVRGFVLLKSLLRESTKKRRLQLDGVTKVTVHPKISLITLTSEGHFFQHNLKEIRPERDLSERRIRKICKETVLEKATKEAVPNSIVSSEGSEEQKKEEETASKPFENKALLNGQFTLGPSLFMKMEARPNLFSKVKETKMICRYDGIMAKKNLAKEPEMSNRAFSETIGHENKPGRFAMFPLAAKRDDKEEEDSKNADLFGGKENDGKLANRAFSGGLFRTESIIKGEENDDAGRKKDEGRSALFGDFKLEKKEEFK